MRRLNATHLLIHEDVQADPRMRARAERMAPRIRAEQTEVVDDERLDELVDPLGLYGRGLHGTQRDVPMVVVLNRYRFGDDAATREARRQQYPNLFRSPVHKLNGYGEGERPGFEWRETGTPAWRAKTGCICQPAWHIHTVVGCPFRCAYCGLGWTLNLMCNLEELVEHLDGWIDSVPEQKLFQNDNWSDIAEFEPEYDSARLFVEYFAGKPGRFFEFYVGKSANVDYLLNLDHRGQTTCCWSLGLPSQCRLIERETASLEARLAAAAECQEAGYPVRLRYSPIVPMRHWREEVRELVARTFAVCRPEMITFETLRYLKLATLEQHFDLDQLAPDFLDAMRDQPAGAEPGSEIPDAFRREIYQTVIDELERVSPGTPYAFCREARATWDHFARDFGRHQQSAEDYICNCGTRSSPDHPLLQLG